MSVHSTAVSEAHFEYIAAHTRGDDLFLRELTAAAQAAGIPEIRIAPGQASLLQILLKAAGARQVVEIGTLAGYSAIAMARALPPDGRVRTIEIDEARARFAESWIRRSDVAGKIEVHRGDARTVLGSFADNSADAAFIDADKDGNVTYLRECLRIVRRGGLICVDNALAFGQLLDPNPSDPDVPAVRAFNEHIARHPGLHGIILPLGDGCWVAVRE